MSAWEAGDVIPFLYLRRSAQSLLHRDKSDGGERNWPCPVMHRLALSVTARFAYPVAATLLRAGRRAPSRGQVFLYSNAAARERSEAVARERRSRKRTAAEPDSSPSRAR